MIIRIEDRHISRAQSIADARQTNRERAGTFNRKQDGNRTDYQIHLYGAMGEVLAASVLGPLESPTAPQIDKGVDLVLHDGRTAAVKTREHSRQWACNPGRGPESFTSDIGVLVWLDSNMTKWNKGVAVLAGWFDRDDFDLHARWTQFGQARRYAYPNSELRPIGELMLKAA